jgi:hypothetical protein
MPNPISVTLSVTQATTVYISVDSYADYQQQATIQTPTGPLVCSGNGEGRRIGFWSYPVPSPGQYKFHIQIQYNSGSGFQNSSQVQAAGLNAVTLNQVVVFSEDAGDNDDNDCLVTFMWFTPVSVAAQ